MQKILSVVVPAVVIAAFILSFWAYPNLPEQVATHWGVSGKPDDYSSREFGAFLMPVLLLGLSILFALLPKIDPLKKNWEEFRVSYNLFIATLFLFLLYIHGIMMYSNLNGNEIDVGQTIIPAVGALFVVIGMIMPKLKRNWFIGIRTPWTISSEESWRKTHLLGSKLFVLSGFATLGMIFWPEIGFWVFMITVLGTVLVLTIYSYLIYKNDPQGSESDK